MTKKRFCDVCDGEIERMVWRRSRDISSGEGSITAKRTLRRRFVDWLLGPYYNYREYGKPGPGNPVMIKMDICSSCRRKISEEMNDDS